jgi:hypothetical protein
MPRTDERAEIKHTMEFPASGLTIMLYEWSDRVVIIARGGLRCVSVDRRDLCRALAIVQGERDQSAQTRTLAPL